MRGGPDRRAVRANHLEFSCWTAGPASGPLALCLHGFPDTATTWRHLMPALAAAGYRVVAPNTRGYAPTEVPADGRYDLETLAADAAALHDALGGDERAVIIGHDWGAATALTAAELQPHRWSKTVVSSWPPTGSLGVDVVLPRTDASKLVRVLSASTLAWRISSGLGSAKILSRLWRDWSPSFDADEDVDRAVAALDRPENLSAATGYYKALPDFNDRNPRPRLSVDPRPALYVHGVDDGCLGIETAARAGEHLSPESQVVHLHGVGHFPQLEAPDHLNRLVLDFLSSTDRAAGPVPTTPATRSVQPVVPGVTTPDS